jgi:hypothetical protein
VFAAIVTLILVIVLIARSAAFSSLPRHQFTTSGADKQLVDFHVDWSWMNKVIVDVPNGILVTLLSQRPRKTVTRTIREESRGWDALRGYTFVKMNLPRSDCEVIVHCPRQQHGFPRLYLFLDQAQFRKFQSSSGSGIYDKKWYMGTDSTVKLNTWKDGMHYFVYSDEWLGSTGGNVRLSVEARIKTYPEPSSYIKETRGPMTVNPYDAPNTNNLMLLFRSSTLNATYYANIRSYHRSGPVIITLMSLSFSILLSMGICTVCWHRHYKSRNYVE